MSQRLNRGLLLPVLFLVACGEKDHGPSAEIRVDTLVEGLEYPTGLWVAGGTIYLTETAGRNTTFGGKVQLDRYDIASGTLDLLLDHPANSDALVAVGSGAVYLASYLNSLPGDEGGVSVVDAVTRVETAVTGLEIAVTDMTLDPSGDIYVLGGSDTPNAASLYRLPATDYSDTTVVKRGLGRAFALARNGNETFFSDLAGIKRMDGIGTVTPLATRAGIGSLAVAGQFLYFADFLAGEIGRVRLTTGVVETVVDGIGAPNTIRYDAGSNSLYIVGSGTQANQFKDGILGVIRELLP